MKRNKLSILLMLVTFICTAFIGCASTGKSAGTSTNKAAKNGYLTTEGGKAVFKNVDYDGNAAVFGKGIDGYDNVTVITCAKSQARNLVTVDLSAYEDMEVDVVFSCDMKVVNAAGEDVDVIWMINEVEANFPQIDRQKVKSGEWTRFSGKKTVALAGKRQFYFSAAGLNKEDLKIFIRNFNLTLYSDDIGKEKVVQISWEEAPSLAEAYKPYFDYIGFATPLSGVLNNTMVQEGLKHQASCITMENEFKPDFVFAWQKPGNLKDFVAEDGKTYKVPGNTPTMESVASILRIAQYLGIKMRGHTLVWHNQTPDWFFRENFGSSKEAYVDPATMNARLEWYIKTVLEFVKDWEAKYNNGEHIIIAWDVVNEAASDSATQKAWIRTNGNWYNVYHNDTYIVNAFRYANKYAPKDVLLAYNDYGCASVAKCGAICNIVDAIRAAPDARIDVVGMQTHVGMNTPVTGPNSFETSVQKFIAKGVDVQITEMDIGQDGQRYNSERLKAKYKEFFTMFLNNRKVDGKNGIRGVTLWGIIDERSWIYNNNGTKQHPLLFSGAYTCKPAFYGVLEAAEEAQQ